MGENSEVSAQSTSTQTNPTFSREDLGAILSGYNGWTCKSAMRCLPMRRL